MHRARLSRIGFILAAIGSAVGLGNIWKFPYITYENGGGSFVLVYLAAILLLGFPIMIAEIALGRASRLSPAKAFEKIASGHRSRPIWKGIGWIIIINQFLLLSFYVVVSGWMVYYIGKSFYWSLHAFDFGDGALSKDFGVFLQNGNQQLLYTTSFIFINGLIVWLGVRTGIENAARLLMPVLAVILIALLYVAYQTPGFSDAISFLFHIGPIDRNGILEAVGHSFFTLSLGMGAMITFGSYISGKQSIVRASIAICFFDTLVALLASIIIFSIIFSTPEAVRETTFARSAVILFTTLPKVLYELPFGFLVGPAFFILLAFAALTSSVMGMEVLSAHCMDQFGWSRRQTVPILALILFAMSIPVFLSFGAHHGLSNWKPIGDQAQGVFGVIDYIGSNWLLPICGLGGAVLAGWVMTRKEIFEQIQIGIPFQRFARIWYFVLRYFVPLGLIWLLIAVISGKHF